VGDKRVKEAVETMMNYRKAAAPVGIVNSAITELGEGCHYPLGEVSGQDIDIDIIVIVGNSEIFIYNGKMVTGHPWGYIKDVGYCLIRPSDLYNFG
jgi:precorrin-3B C17-methyltransferase